MSTLRAKNKVFLLEEYIKGSNNTEVIRVHGTDIKITDQDTDNPVLYILHGRKTVYAVSFYEVRRVIMEDAKAPARPPLTLIPQ